MNNNASGIEMLKSAGVDKNFISSMFNKYGKYAGKLGMSQNSLKSMVDQISNSLEGKSVPDNARNTQRNKLNKGFNQNKYPRV